MITPSYISNRHPKTQRAFSLIEILIVVIVLGILTALVMPRFASAKDSSSDGVRKTHLRSVEKALEQYYGKHDYYPNTGGGWWGDAPSYGGKGYTGDNGYIPGLAPQFLRELPKDPTVAPAGQQGYLYKSNGKDYKFLAHKTPKSFGPDQQYHDPRRKTWAWMVSSPGGRNW